MVFRPIDLYVITSTFFTFFFQNPKNVTFYVFCRVSYVFSNNGIKRTIKAKVDVLVTALPEQVVSRDS